MRKLVGIGAFLLCAAIAALIIPLWVSTAGVGLPFAGNASIVLMVIFCFAIGGGLMFLVFYSARTGHDDAAHLGGGSGRPDPPPDELP